MKELYSWGDLSAADYRRQRDHELERQRAALVPVGPAADDGLRKPRNSLRDLPAAWAAATPEERNEMLRTLFEAVRVDDGRIVAVRPVAGAWPTSWRSTVGYGRDAPSTSFEAAPSLTINRDSGKPPRSNVVSAAPASIVSA